MNILLAGIFLLLLVLSPFLILAIIFQIQLDQERFLYFGLTLAQASILRNLELEGIIKEDLLRQFSNVPSKEDFRLDIEELIFKGLVTKTDLNFYMITPQGSALIAKISASMGAS